MSQIEYEAYRAERKNVGLAAQLFSYTTATALMRYLPGNENQAKSTSLFIELVSNWFDTMISYTPKQNLCTKRPYGLLLMQQKVLSVADSIKIVLKVPFLK